MTKEAVERNTKRSCGEDNGHTETAFISAIPKGDVEDDTRENTAFGKAKNGASDEEGTKGFHSAHQGHTKTCGHGDNTEPAGWADPPKKEIAWNCSCGVEWKEQRESDLTGVVQTLHLEVSVKR